jgi:hypothetical protein
MIQRIQSVYLFLAALINGYLLLGDGTFYTATGARHATLTFTSVTISDVKVYDTVSQLLLLAIAVTCLFSIFSFRKRQLQIKLCWAIAALLILLGVMTFIRYKNLTAQLGASLDGSLGFGFLAPVLSLVFVLLALRGVLQDERTIRDMDRLR